MNHQPLTKIVSFCLIFTFLGTEISYSAPLEGLDLFSKKPLEVLSQDPTRFEAPLGFSTLKEIHKGANDTFIIHIQDAHSNLSGQENLSRTLDELMTRYQVSLVLVEGGSKDDTLTPIKTIAPPTIWRQVAKKFLVEGKISGEEYLNLTSDRLMKIIGVEDVVLYHKSKQNYAQLADQRTNILNFLRKTQKKLKKIKNRLYPQELLDYENNHLSVPGVQRRSNLSDNDDGVNFDNLFYLSKKYSIDFAEFPNMQKLSNLKKKSIQFETAHIETSSLIQLLKNKKFQIENLEQVKNSKASQLSFFQNLSSAAKENNISMEAYPEFLHYIEYLKEFSTIDLDAMLDEMQKVEDQVYKTVISGEKALTPPLAGDAGSEASVTPMNEHGGVAQVVGPADALLARAMDRYFKLLIIAYSIQMSTKDFDFFRANESDFGMPECLAWMNRKLLELGYAEDLIPSDDCLRKGRESLEQFYASVSARDEVFVANARKALTTEKQKVAILITGGYHTQHLKELFQKEGWSYAVVTPIVTTPTNQKKYEDLLLEEIRPAKKVVTSSIDAPLGIARKTEGVRATALWESLRLNLIVSTAASMAGTTNQVLKVLPAARLAGHTSEVSDLGKASLLTGARLADNRWPYILTGIFLAYFAASAALTGLEAARGQMKIFVVCLGIYFLVGLIIDFIGGISHEMFLHSISDDYKLDQTWDGKKIMGSDGKWYITRITDRGQTLVLDAKDEIHQGNNDKWSLTVGDREAPMRFGPRIDNGKTIAYISFGGSLKHPVIKFFEVIPHYRGFVFLKLIQMWLDELPVATTVTLAGIVNNKLFRQNFFSSWFFGIGGKFFFKKSTLGKWFSKRGFEVLKVYFYAGQRNVDLIKARELMSGITTSNDNNAARLAGTEDLARQILSSVIARGVSDKAIHPEAYPEIDRDVTLFNGARDYSGGARLADVFAKPPGGKLTSEKVLRSQPTRNQLAMMASTIVGDYDLQVKASGGFVGAQFTFVPMSEGGVSVIPVGLQGAAPIHFAARDIQNGKRQITKLRTAQARRATDKRTLLEAVKNFTERENASRKIFSGFVSGLTQTKWIHLNIDISGYADTRDLVSQIGGLVRSLEKNDKLILSVQWRRGEKILETYGGIDSLPAPENVNAVINLGQASQDLLKVAAGYAILMTPKPQSWESGQDIQLFNFGADLCQMIVASLSGKGTEVVHSSLRTVFGPQMREESISKVLSVEPGALLEVYEVEGLFAHPLKAIPLNLFEAYLRLRAVVVSA